MRTDPSEAISPYGVQLEHTVTQTVGSMPAMHAHPTHELYFLLSGQRRYFVEHTIYDVAVGDLMLIPRTQFHRAITSGGKNYDRYVLYFYESDHRGFIDLIGRPVFEELMQSGCLQFPPRAARQLQQDLEQLERELAKPDAHTRAISAHLLQDILLTALRSGTRKPPFQGESADKVQEAARYISTHYSQPITLHDAAQMAFMEETYFSKRFKALTGVGFREYLTQTRLRAAEQMLLETDLSMSEIAEHCGFSGGNYFGDVFLRHHGISPSDYRKKIRK